jgi:hypothetical protein
LVGFDDWRGHGTGVIPREHVMDPVPGGTVSRAFEGSLSSSVI